MSYSAVALLLLSLVIYLPPYKQAFVGDDYLHLGYVAEFLQHPLAALRVLNPLWTEWYYRPLQNLWFLFCRLLFDLSPFGYYFLQSLWNAVAASALISVGRRLRLPAPAIAGALALFTVHSHHHDVVAWISSISVIMTTTFSLLAILVYVRFLQDAGNHYQLISVALFALLAMLSHEEGLLLPVFLLGARLIIWNGREIGRRERVLFTLLILGSLALGLTHFFRPNSTIALQSRDLNQWFASLHPLRLAEFLLVVSARWLLLNKSAAGLTVYAAMARQPLPGLIVATTIVVLLVYACWRGSRVVRLAMLWILPHLAFLYASLCISMAAETRAVRRPALV